MHHSNQNIEGAPLKGKLWAFAADRKTNSKRDAKEWLIALTGSFLLVLLSQCKIPIGPVPHSLQTLGVLWLGLFLSPRQAFSACCLYLAQATAGLPVLAGWSIDPLWFLTPRAGYLLAFPLAAFVVSCLKQRLQSLTFLKLFSIAIAGKIVIYGCGVGLLCLYTGPAAAVTLGFYPFLYTALIKTTVAASSCLGFAKLNFACFQKKKT